MNAPDLQDMPDEVLQAMGEKTSMQKQEMLEGLASTIASLRKEAIDARRASGIEEVWLQAEEAYIGIDDVNRGEFANARWAKPLSQDGPLTSERSRRDAIRSTAFVRLTARYVDAGSSKIGEISLPVDGKSFNISPTPNPDLVKFSEINAPATAQGQPLIKQPEQSGQPAVQATVADVAKQDMEISKKCAEKAETRILDWLTESRYRTEMRKVIFDAARIGTGVLKGPFPICKTKSASKKTDSGYEIEIEEKIFPGVKWVDPWNCYPDASCGDDVHNGDGFFELDYLSPRRLRKLKKDPSYLADQIDKVIEEGPDHSNPDSRNPNEKNVLKDKRFKVWNYYGTIKKDEFKCSCANDKMAKSVKEDVFAIVTMVNETIIKAVINPSPSGKFPYRIMNWQSRAGSWAGIGIAEQISMPQRAVNGAARAMFDNAGISSGVQIVIDRGSIEPADGQWNIGRNKLWYKSADATIDDVRKAFATFEVPSLQQQLLNIVNWGMQQGEEATSIPLITQGFSGTNSPDTYGAAQLQNNNANQLLRDIGHRLDDSITEPMIHEYYDYLLLDPDVPDDEKGDFDIDAHGTSSLIERYIQAQEILQMGGIVLNPAFGLNPKSWAEQLLRSQHLDPTKFQYTPEEQQKLDSQPPVPAPAVQVAQIRAESDQIIAKTETEARLKISHDDTDRDAIYVQAQTARDESTAQAELQKLQVIRETAQINRELKMIELADKKGMNLDQLKTRMAETAAKLKTQRDLSVMELTHGHIVKNVLTPPTEPAGRAEPGKSFQG